jgi:hypothetical protein
MRLPQFQQGASQLGGLAQDIINQANAPVFKQEIPFLRQAGIADLGSAIPALRQGGLNLLQTGMDPQQAREAARCRPSTMCRCVRRCLP